jgi:hypothetical protein
MEARHQQRDQQDRKHVNHIQKLYDSGIPWFTKEIISDVATKLQALGGQQGTIELMDLGGMMTKYQVIPGTPVDSGQTQLEGFL